MEPNLPHSVCNDNDTWTREAVGQIENYKDFVAAEATYHLTCYALLRHGRSFKVGEAEKIKGRMNMLPCFCCTYECLEGETKPYTMSELETKMREIVNSDNVFSKKYLKTNSSQAKKKAILFILRKAKECQML